MSNRPRHVWRILPVAAISCLLFAAAAAAEEKVAFRTKDVPNPAEITVKASAQRAVIRAFLDKYPQYEIKRFFMPEVGAGASGMDSGPLMGIAAGIPPNAIYVNFRNSSTYIGQGFLDPIEILLARVRSKDERVRQTDSKGRWLADPGPQEIAEALELLRQRTPPGAWEVVYRENVSNSDGTKHVWAVPTQVLVMAMLYRKDVFYEAGLDPQRPPKDWDEFLEYARRLTVPERKQYGFVLQSTPDGWSWSSYAFMVSNGARAVRLTPEGQWVAAYGSRENAEAIEYIWRLVRQPFVRDGRTIEGATKTYKLGHELDTMWQRGQIAMRFTYLQEEVLGDINPQQVGVAPVPLSRRGTRGSELNCRMLGVFSGSTPQQKLAVMNFIWFVTSDEAKKIRTDIYVREGFGQFVNPVLLEKFGYTRILRQVPKGWLEAFNVALNAGVPEPYGRNTQFIYTYMTDPIEDAVLNFDFSNTSREDAVDQIHEILKDSAERANIDLLGNLPPEQMRKRRGVAMGTIVLIVIVFIVGAVALWRFFTAAAPVTTEGGKRGHAWWATLMLLPALTLTLIWLYVPLIGALGLSLTDYRLAIDSRFVGVDNFANSLFEPRFWASLRRTFYFVALTIGLGFWPPILLAILLDEVPTAPLKYLFRTIFYLPAVISGVIIMFLWRQLYDASASGPLNQLLLALNTVGPIAATVIKLAALACWVSLIGVLIYLPIKMDDMSRLLRGVLWLVAVALIGTSVAALARGDVTIGGLVGSFALVPLAWTDSPQMAMLCVVLPLVWAGTGPGCILYLAALKTVPDELYEAADIDGAGIWHKICYITLPRLKFLIGIQLIAAVVGAFKGGTDYILALTGGGPQDSTLILALHIFVRAFMHLEFGLGTAMAWLLGALLLGFTAYQLKMLSRAEFKAAASDSQ